MTPMLHGTVGDEENTLLLATTAIELQKPIMRTRNASGML